MYVPEHFAQQDEDALWSLIEAAPLGVLVRSGAGGLDADHIPFEPDRAAGVLRAHLARANPAWRALEENPEVMVIFRAGAGYVSPSWYPSKHVHHRQVPTWNYRVVHVHGRATVRNEPAFVRRNVARLTARHEAGEAQPWRMADAPRDFLDAMVAAVVGIEIRIERLTGKDKLSQNKEAADIRSAADVLEGRGAADLAAAMHRAAEDKGRR